jgi:hypothetical protein
MVGRRAAVATLDPHATIALRGNPDVTLKAVRFIDDKKSLAQFPLAYIATLGHRISLGKPIILGVSTIWTAARPENNVEKRTRKSRRE